MWKKVVINRITFPYEVSSDGKVKNSVSGKILNFEKTRDGYFRVRLYNNTLGFNKKFLVHRLVANAFIDNFENLPVVNHKDGDKSNNDVSNLEWCSVSYNIQHAFRNGLIKPNKCEKHHNSIYTNKQIRKVCILLETGLYSFKEISDKTGVKDEFVVSAIYNRKIWVDISKDFIFKKKKSTHQNFHNFIDRAIIAGISRKKIVTALSKYMSEKRATSLFKHRQEIVKRGDSVVQKYSIYIDEGVDII